MTDFRSSAIEKDRNPFYMLTFQSDGKPYIVIWMMMETEICSKVVYFVLIGI